MTNRDERDRINRVLANEEEDADRNGERSGSAVGFAVLLVLLAGAVLVASGFFHWLLGGF